MADTTKASMTTSEFTRSGAVLTQEEVDFYMKRGRQMRAEAAAEFSRDVSSFVRRGFEALPALWSRLDRLFTVGRPQASNR